MRDRHSQHSLHVFSRFQRSKVFDLGGEVYRREAKGMLPHYIPNKAANRTTRVAQTCF